LYFLCLYSYRYYDNRFLGKKPVIADFQILLITKTLAKPSGLVNDNVIIQPECKRILFERVAEMKITIDIKTLIAGMILGAIIIMVSGAGEGSADTDRFGIAIPTDGYGLIRTQDGGFFVVNPKNAMASRVMSYSNLTSTPDNSRTIKGYLLNTDTISRPIAK